MKRLFKLMCARIAADVYQMYMCLRHVEPYCVYESRDARGRLRTISVARMDEPETCRTFFGPHEPQVIARIAAAREHFNHYRKNRS